MKPLSILGMLLLATLPLSAQVGRAGRPMPQARPQIPANVQRPSFNAPSMARPAPQMPQARPQMPTMPQTRPQLPQARPQMPTLPTMPQTRPNLPGNLPGTLPSTRPNQPNNLAEALVMVQQAGPEAKASAFAEAKEHLRAAAGACQTRDVPLGLPRWFHRAVRRLSTDSGLFAAKLWAWGQRLWPWVKG